MSQRTNIRPRRRLRDLYVKGKEVRFSEEGAAIYGESEQGERVLEAVYDLDNNPVDITETEWTDDAGSQPDLVVWVQPPNPHQREQALRESQAERSKTILRAKRDLDSPEHTTTESFVSDMSQETLIEYVLGVDEPERREEAQRAVLMRDEWMSAKDKDDEDKTKVGFSELQDLLRQWDEAGRPHDDEWQPVLDRDVEFGRQVSEESDRLRESSRESLKMLPRPDLEERAKRRHVETLANQAFMARYEREMLFYSVRDGENHNQLHWESIDDMLSEDEYPLNVLTDTYATFITEVREAKNARRAAPGSPSAEPPVEPETSEASTPTEPSE